MKANFDEYDRDDLENIKGIINGMKDGNVGVVDAGKFKKMLEDARGVGGFTPDQVDGINKLIGGVDSYGINLPRARNKNLAAAELRQALTDDKARLIKFGSDSDKAHLAINKPT